MPNEKNSTRYLGEISQILEDVRGKSLSLEERKRKTIDLASILLEQSEKELTYKDRRLLKKVSKMIVDPLGKAFMVSMTDQCFRSRSNFRVAIQLNEILARFGSPPFLSLFDRLQIIIFRLLPVTIAQFFIPLLFKALRKETEHVILPAERPLLKKHILKRTEEGVRLNINHLGEAILGEKEAKKRLQLYLDDLRDPLINYVSIKISTIFSQINLLSYEDTVEKIADRLRSLYKMAIENPTKDQSGNSVPKFVNLDMEQHKDLHVTIDVFKKVLSEPEFIHFPAGIVFQAYLPESFPLFKDLVEWAKERVKKGGSYVKVRVVKGANLANEQVEASIRSWPQTPYTSKVEVDANYKNILLHAFIPENATAVHIGVASHNLFDIAFALLLRSENNVIPYVDFEMLEGMSDHVRKAIQKVSGSMLLYCPVSLAHDFQYAISYLIRRLDENTGAENFLKHIFNMKPGSASFEEQAEAFSKSCDEIETIFHEPRKSQNRFQEEKKPDSFSTFENEPDTDFSHLNNIKWSQKIIEDWKEKTFDPIPLVISGNEKFTPSIEKGFDPSNPEKPFYEYALAQEAEIEEVISSATNYFSVWSKTPLKKRCELLAEIAHSLRTNRKDLLGCMMRDTGKILIESDAEISEAIDNAEYYLRRIEKLFSFQDIEWQPKGVVLVTPPWNFPCAIPLGGIVGALVCGNSVIFKPAPESVLVGWIIVNLLWKAGVPKEALQFINCRDEPEGEKIIKDSRISLVVLTGSTETAKKFLRLRPDIDLSAETGGKNALIITAMSDRDLAIESILHSAFSHSGQKCSACSLLILEQEVYDDLHFFKQLKDAAESLIVGKANDLKTKVNPLIREPNDTLMQGLTVLDKDEEWLLKPVRIEKNLWSPGIKIHVLPQSFSHQTEFFGPVLSIMKAKNLEHAVQLANATPYGLTSGLHSLDEQEHYYWIQNIEAGNCYINRTTTGAIIRRQPFGGCKNSSFGNAYKAGGPNYLYNFLHAKQLGIPKHKSPVNEAVNNLTALVDKLDLSAEELGLWYASIANYSFWYRKMRFDRDPTKLVGQDNFLRYIPRADVALRLTENSLPLDVLRIIAAALTCFSPLYISFPPLFQYPLDLRSIHESLTIVSETGEEFFESIKKNNIRRVRMVGQIPKQFFEQAAHLGCHIASQPVLANGRFELLHYVRELSISIDYHRYGNLGLRENELRKPIE